ncbi:MAG: hypothetical protein DRP29_04940 [Thermodesulfobacteriota bacterium]|nr:MAG: hypothetical protein DRP29_04940 [Thermodesulfobacteriota bacterium]
MFYPPLKIQTGKRAIICFTLPEWNFLNKNLFFERGLTWLNIKIKYNSDAIILGPLIGAPIVAMVLELLSNLGIKEILGIGWAGKINTKLNLGDLLLPQKAYSLEGVSKLYFPSKKVFFPNEKLLNIIEKEMNKQFINYKKGNILSTDVPFKIEKNKGFLEKWKKKINAIDMETSALFSVGNALNLKVVNICFITDEIGKTTYRKPEEKIMEIRKKLLKLLEKFVSYKI